MISNLVECLLKLFRISGIVINPSTFLPITHSFFTFSIQYTFTLLAEALAFPFLRSLCSLDFLAFPKIRNVFSSYFSQLLFFIPLFTGWANIHSIVKWELSQIKEWSHRDDRQKMLAWVTMYGSIDNVLRKLCQTDPS